MHLVKFLRKYKKIFYIIINRPRSDKLLGLFNVIKKCLKDGYSLRLVLPLNFFKTLFLRLVQ